MDINNLHKEGGTYHVFLPYNYKDIKLAKAYIKKVEYKIRVRIF